MIKEVRNSKFEVRSLNPLTGIVLIIILNLLVSSLSAQKKISLQIEELGSAKVITKIKYQTSFSNIKDREKELRNVLTSLWNDSYLAARYDSILQDSIHLTAYLNPGEKHQWASIRKGNVDEGILSEIGFREKNWRNRPLRYKEVARIQEDILNWCENNGYPFASVRLDSLNFSNQNSVAGVLQLTKNRFTKIDSIEVKGNLKVSTAWLYNYMGIAPNDPYNQDRIDVLPKRLRELAFARETKPFTILFTEKYTKITLFLEKKKAGQFDGIVGILPDSRTGKVLFTGDVRLKLQNSFAHGELIELNWRRLQEQTQDLKARVDYPYLLRSPVGAQYAIKLYRRDTSFIDVNQTLGLQYQFSANTAISTYIRRRSSNLLSITGLENTTVLPSYADIKTTSYGIGFRHERFDYRFNPRKGFGINFTTDIGNRTIEKNANLNPIIYDNIKLRSVQFGSELVAEKFWPIGKRATIKTGIQAAWLYNSTGVFRNELYRIGGLKTLRGFDEESIFASAYSIGTLEYRFLLEENSWLFLFSDFCWYENNSRAFFISDTPYSFGTGITFETKAGIFALTYALGSQFGNAPDFRNGKIHVGFVGLF
jgi:outer membrane protein assembly factor BamA